MDGRCEDFSYQVIYKKVRHMTIRVTAAAQVIVTAPYGYPKKTVRGFVEAKSGWIRKHLAQMQEKQTIVLSELSFGEDEERQDRKSVV